MKCSECGFLALRNRFTGVLDEVDGEFRATGNPPRRRAVGPPRLSTNVVPALGVVDPGVSTGEIWPYVSMPVCFVQRYDLWRETHLERGANVPANMVLEVIDSERDCATAGSTLGFTTWQQGLSPRDHRDMLDRNYDQERAERWRREDKREERLWRVIELVVFGFAGAIVALTAAYISRG